MQTNFNLDKRVLASFSSLATSGACRCLGLMLKELQKQAVMLICWSSLIQRTFPA